MTEAEANKVIEINRAAYLRHQQFLMMKTTHSTEADAIAYSEFVAAANVLRELEIQGAR